jgi:hypothetical protein
MFCAPILLFYPLYGVKEWQGTQKEKYTKEVSLLANPFYTKIWRLPRCRIRKENRQQISFAHASKMTEMRMGGVSAKKKRNKEIFSTKEDYGGMVVVSAEMLRPGGRAPQ